MIKFLAALLVAVLVLTAASPVHAANDITSLASADHEIALIFKSGTLLAAFEGDNRAAAVAISPRFRDAELWHSHVYPGLPDDSPDDLYVAFRDNLTRMCAVSLEATCCAERIGLRWKPRTRAETRQMTAAIYAAIAGHPRAEQITIHRAIVQADAAQRGYTYACW